MRTATQESARISIVKIATVTTGMVTTGMVTTGMVTTGMVTTGMVTNSTTPMNRTCRRFAPTARQSPWGRLSGAAAGRDDPQQILWEPSEATDAEARAMEVRLTRELRTNNPEVGYI
jgi:hypothetical protein